MGLRQASQHDAYKTGGSVYNEAWDGIFSFGVRPSPQIYSGLGGYHDGHFTPNSWNDGGA